MREPLVLDQSFQDILQQLEHTSNHYFVTGRAGTGKSTLLQLFRKTTNKKVVVLSPTGIAALNVQGQTIHSFFQFAPKLQHAKELFLVRRLVNLMRALEVVIIDEISMVRADVMDAIDYSLKLHRQNPLPFGGVQMIFFGDLFQLPPVLSSQEEKLYFSTHYDGPYFFHAHVWKEKLSIQLMELTKVYRQRERNFIRLLESIRSSEVDYEVIDELNERFLPDAVIPEPYLTLCSTNAAAQTINAERLQQIASPSFFFHAEVQGDFATNMYPTDYKLELREGAQLMMIRNDPEKRFVNGTLATIVALNADTITVTFGDDKEPVNISQMIWEINRYKYNEANSIEAEVVGSFKQYPVRLAWAVTIHKSQGQTYDRVAVDLGRGAFEHGQTYVALSRCRTLDGLFLKKRLTQRDIFMDERIAEFYQRIR